MASSKWIVFWPTASEHPMSNMETAGRGQNASIEAAKESVEKVFAEHDEPEGLLGRVMMQNAGEITEVWTYKQRTGWVQGGVADNTGSTERKIRDSDAPKRTLTLKPGGQSSVKPKGNGRRIK